MKNNEKYISQLYEHSKFSLPPNIAIPNTPTMQFFLITINDLIYLNKKTLPLLKIRWWGYSQSHITVLKNNKQILFPIHSSKNKFLNYCQDMHILQFQLCQSQPNQSFLCKTGLNMKSIAMWQGQNYSIVLDLIRNSKKVGEISLSIQIVQRQNFNYIKNTLSQANQDFSNKPTVAKFNQKRSSQKPQNSNQRKQNYSQSNWSKITEPHAQHNQQQSQQCEHQFIARKNPQQLLKQQFGPCICSRINDYNTQAEIFKLHQDCQLIFGLQNKKPEMQTIQLQFLQWVPSQKVRNGNKGEIYSNIVVIQFPLPNHQMNRYEFKGNQVSSIKVGINNSYFSQRQIQQYVKKASISIEIGSQYTGSVGLSKALSQCGQSLFVPMTQNGNKKGTKVVGHCHLRIVPPRQLTNQTKQKQVITSNNLSDKQRISKQQSNQKSNKRTSMYTWIFINQFIPLKCQNYKNSNIFVRIAHGQQKTQPIETNTVWKCSKPTFRYIVTLQTKQSYHLELWDRQKRQLLVGTAEVKSGFKWQQNIPVRNIKGQVVGYLTVCVGTGSLIDANRFMQLHMKPEKKVIQKQQSDNSKKQNSQAEYQQGHQINKSLTHYSSQKNEINDRKQHVIDQQISPKKNYQQPMSLLDLHNIVFTRILTHNEQIPELRQNSLKLTQFQRIIFQVGQKYADSQIPPWAISKLASFYLNHKSNRVNMQLFSQSFEAFTNYYKYLCDQRNLVIKQFLDDLMNSGLSVNLLEIQLLSSNNTWQTLKQVTNNLINIQKLRVYYGSINSVQLCDKFRRFEVFQNTFGQSLPTQEIKNYIIDQLSDIFEIRLQRNHNKLRQALKQSQVQLSKWQQLNIFDNQNHYSSQISDRKKPEFIKCPTFGYLGLQNMSAQVNQQLQNTSIIANISPIYANKNSIWALFSNIDDKIKKMVVNGIQIQSNNYSNHRLKLQNVRKQFSYSVMLQIEDNIYQTQGFFNQWMGLTDQNGNYGGCLKICGQNLS